MFTRLFKKSHIVLLFIWLSLVILSSCASPNSVPAGKTSSATSHLTPLPTFQGIVAPICNGSLCTVNGDVPGGRAFIDTWQNIHLFQSFDYHIQNPAAVAKYYDFVWGANVNKVSAYRAGNPNITLSYYLSFFRESGVFGNADTHQSVDYWKSVHPDWLLYRCDRVTPAFEDGQLDIAPFDFTNPDFVNWQVQTYALPASQHDYDAIAADNLNMENLVGACGSYKNGVWVQRYSGETNDPRWRADVLSWVTMMQKALHALPHPLALIPNLGVGAIPLTDATLQQVVEHVDGILDESGFTDYGQGYVTGDEWLQMVQFIKNVQGMRKAYYIGNEFQTAVLGQADVAWVLASYLMCKQHTAAVFISLAQQYGSDLHATLSLSSIGTPAGDMYQAQHVYWREYTRGLSIVNPSNDASYTVQLPGLYTDMNGQGVGQTLVLPAHSGAVLLS